MALDDMTMERIWEFGMQKDAKNLACVACVGCGK